MTGDAHETQNFGTLEFSRRGAERRLVGRCHDADGKLRWEGVVRPPPDIRPKCSSSGGPRSYRAYSKWSSIFTSVRRSRKSWKWTVTWIGSMKTIAYAGGS